ncbi:hypothetical protein Dimus_009870 [Dionaea muscipula]
MGTVLHQLETKYSCSFLVGNKLLLWVLVGNAQFVWWRASSHSDISKEKEGNGVRKGGMGEGCVGSVLSPVSPGPHPIDFSLYHSSPS